MEVSKSEFTFLGYKINKCVFDIKGNPMVGTLQYDVSLNGNLDDEKQIFTLNMELAMKDGEVFTLNLESEAKFSYKGIDKEKLVTFLGMNAPAVLYPYIRSYVTMLTINASVEPLVLPPMNLMPVGKKLVEDLLEQT